MAQRPKSRTGHGLPGVAPLTNVHLMATAVERLRSRGSGLPGIAVVHGPSGTGKSTAATYCATAVGYNAAVVQVKSVWSRSSFLAEVATVLGLPRGRTMADNISLIGQELTNSRRPLIIDEADYLAETRARIEVVRDIHETAANPSIVLIGEEGLPHKLKQFERFHNRVLVWAPAELCSVDDAAMLAEIHLSGLEVDRGFLGAVVAGSKGITRRVATNLDKAGERAAVEQWPRVDLAHWGDEPFFDGEPPKRRLS